MTTHTTQPQVLQVDFSLDVICPWCWMGLRQWERAAALWRSAHPDVALHMRWHASPLLPHIPPEGLPYQSFYVARLGSREAVERRRAQVLEHARPLDLRICFDAIERFPNSTLACALVQMAQEQLTAQQMVPLLESIFAAYFSHGLDIGDLHVLQSIAADAGVQCTPEQLEAAGLRLRPGSAVGVPHYDFNRAFSVTGAVPATELYAAMRRAVEAAHSHA